MVVLVVVGLMLIASDLVVDPGGLTDGFFLLSSFFFFFFLFSAYLSGGLGVRPLQVLFMNGSAFFFFSPSLFDSSSEFPGFFFAPALFAVVVVAADVVPAETEAVGLSFSDFSGLLFSFGLRPGLLPALLAIALRTCFLSYC